MTRLRIVSEVGSLASETALAAEARQLGCPRSVIVAGASATGKTTLIAGLRSEEFADRIVIPTRYVTRSARADDEATENVSVDHPTFETHIASGRIAVEWSRTFERGRTERYGFEAVRRSDPRLVVYSGNNALLTAREPSVVALLRDSLLVMVTCGKAIRKQRLSHKQMRATERHSRLQDPTADLGGHGVQVIDTSELTEAEGQAAFRCVIAQLVSAKLAA
jgi:ribose 1,5-bisphosphokinase PhnN